MISNSSKLVALTLLLYAAISVSQVVFKWTDENGVVHYGESVPPGIENFERLGITSAPDAPSAPLRPQQEEPFEQSVTGPSPPGPTPSSPGVVPAPATGMSLEDLDRLCENAREREIAPLQAAAIAECKENRRTDPAYCERFYADFGDAGLTESGAVRPRMFNNLPECVQAEEVRRSLPRR